MKQVIILTTVLLCSYYSMIGQNEITNDDIFFKNKFSQDWVYGLNSMNNGLEYTTLESNGDTTLIEKYNYLSGAKISTVLSSSQINNIKFVDYKFNLDENLILIETDSSPIYRYSKESIFYVYNMETSQLNKISDKKIRLATFSPDSKYISYIWRNNIYIYDVKTKKTKKITYEGVPNKIICGGTDWVYEEEFGLVQGYEWSPSSQYIAYFLFDESKVAEFSMDMFKNNLYPYQEKFKYPKAGEVNSKVSINIYNLSTEEHINAKVNKKSETYFPRINWTNKSKKLFVQRLNRHQNQLDLLAVDPENGKSEIIYQEADNAYIEVHENLTFLKDDSGFLWTSEKDGYNHIYLFQINGNFRRQVTKGKWEVTKFYGYDDKNKTLYYQSTEKSPLKRDIYSISIFGSKKKLLTKNEGTNNAVFSKKYEYFINTYSNANTPNHISLLSSKGNEIRVIKKSEKLKNILSNYNLSKKEFFQFTTQNDKLKINGWMMKPNNFDKSKQYPVLMYVYGGPGSQTVKDNWDRNYMWYQSLCNKGYIIVSIDNRGTGGRGAEFKKCTYKELGKLETIDQIEGAKYLASLDYVDSERIGIWGWSYGGYMSSLCILKGNQQFNTAIAVAPVTNWRFYDTIYTERYMQTPQENKDGYDLNSPINHVDSLRGNYLLIHGTADDNVHVQNTYEMVNALVNANKKFDLFLYPDKNHSIYGGYTRLHLFNQITDFITKNL